MNLKNRSDLADFPDGGRATLVRRYSPASVRRYSPALTKRQLDILIYVQKYEAATLLAEGEYRDAVALTCMGLLERPPEPRAVFRISAAGADVVHRWKSAGW